MLLLQCICIFKLPVVDGSGITSCVPLGLGNSMGTVPHSSVMNEDCKRVQLDCIVTGAWNHEHLYSPDIDSNVILK